MMTAAESGDLGERLQGLAMSLMSSFAALGADVNNIQFAFLHSSRDELEQEVRRLMVANPKVQALIEAFQNEVRRIASKDAIRGGILTLCQETFLQLQRIDGNCSEEEKALFERMKYNFKETIKTVATGLADLTGHLTNRLLIKIVKSTFHVADQDREVNFPLISVQIQALSLMILRLAELLLSN